MLAALVALPAPERVASLALSGATHADKGMAIALARRIAAMPALARFQLRGLDLTLIGLCRLLLSLSRAPALVSLDLGDLRSYDADKELREVLSGGGWQKLKVRGRLARFGLGAGAAPCAVCPMRMRQPGFLRSRMRR